MYVYTYTKAVRASKKPCVGVATTLLNSYVVYMLVHFS